MSESLQDRVSSAIGHQYAIEHEIGRGGMSVVYRARDIRLNRLVALKVLPPDLAYDAAIRMRFTREAQTSAQLTHPHIVPIYDVGEKDGIAYFVMALVTGGNLANLLAREPRQPIEEVRRVLREVSDALACAHQFGIVHRDIKPDNILIDGDTGRTMVTDFGIARAMEAGPRLTQTGIAVGTPTYMSPEQATGEREIDGRSDIYSLGIVAYQMLTGRVPFTAGNPMSLLLKHVTEKPRPIHDLRPDSPRGLVEVIERALMKDPEDRWPDAAALRDGLMMGDTITPTWRAEHHQPVRFVSPPRGTKRDRVATQSKPPEAPVVVAAPVVPPVVVPMHGSIILEQPHLVTLTEEQRADLRLWHGRVNLLDRIRAQRWYFLWTLGAIGGGIAGFVFGVEEAPPFVLAPLISGYIAWKFWKRSKSLQASGVKMKRVLLMPRRKWVLPHGPKAPSEAQLEKLVPREVLEGPHGSAIRRAVDDRTAILEIVSHFSRADRAVFPDLPQLVKALVDRVADLAKMHYSLNREIDWKLMGELDARIADAARQTTSLDAQRQLALLQRQRATLDELVQRLDALSRQVDSAGLALGNLRYDLIKFRSSGEDGALSDVSSATQEVRAVQREIDLMLESAAEVRGL